jgi:hypothetical protein
MFEVSIPGDNDARKAISDDSNYGIRTAGGEKITNKLNLVPSINEYSGHRDRNILVNQ